MTQRTEVTESATLSQVGQGDIYAMSFRELDAFVDAGVRRIALRQADIIKARRALRPAILRVHDALSCRGRRTDLLDAPAKLTFDEWVRSKEHLGSRATIYRLLAEAGMRQKKQLDKGTKVKGKVGGKRKAGVVTRVRETDGGPPMADVLFEGEKEAVACVAEKLVRVSARRIAVGDILVFEDTGAEYRYEGGGKLVLTAAPSKAGRKKQCGTAKAERKKAAAAAAGRGV